ALQRWFDRFAHELAAARFKKQQLGLRHHAGALRCKLQKLANRFTDGGAARFARHQKWNTGSLETGGESLHLCGFAAPFRSFERDEWDARHQSDSETKRCSCRMRAEWLTNRA